MYDVNTVIKPTSMFYKTLPKYNLLIWVSSNKRMANLKSWICKAWLASTLAEIAVIPSVKQKSVLGQRRTCECLTS